MVKPALKGALRILAVDYPKEHMERILGPADELQIRLLLRLPPAQRVSTMLSLQEVLLRTWRERLRRAYPHLTDLALCRIMFERLTQNG